MANFYTLSPSGCPENQVLFPTIRPTFIAAGHGFTDDVQEADCFLIDLHSRLFTYNQSVVEYIVSSRKPVVTFDEWDRGGMSKEDWPWPLTNQQQQLFDYIEAKSVHFCRLLDKNQKYSLLHYPYEKPILYEEPPISADDLFNRPYDVCFIANTSPQREAIAAALRSDKRLKCIIKLGEQKIPFNEWVDLHRQAKFFVSASAGGYSNERIQNLFSVAALIQERTDQLLLHPFSHAMNCLKVHQPPTQLDLQIIVDFCRDKERLFAIYKNGYTFTKLYYSQEFIASYMLAQIQKHGLI